ncbi:MAG: 2-C-methyl-D-erythritol 2,4-cyclodiphosphate synthase [SAR86 cluster bacterium]|nr:2-C-methyl-D-erythritol 2,4-cyclodiphosphate synthase [SAR86 cluster bacterium]|tara:strand:+ start:7445 stop:8584 length:1140 start_codon:yes stop_codon:yes gene_type:complete
MKIKKILAVIPAAGIGHRFGEKKPKQYAQLNALSVIENTVNELLKSKLIDKLIIVISEGDRYIKNQNFYKNKTIQLINGGSSRAESVNNALNHECANGYDYVLVHDAARPNFSYTIISKLLENLMESKSSGSFPYIPISDSLRSKELGTVDKNEYFLAQTPQVCSFHDLKQSLQLCISDGVNVPDESFALEYSGFNVSRILGSRSNIKITYKDDLKLLSKFNTRTGTGFDVHRYQEGNGITLGGFKVPCEYSIIAHSDGDVLLHSIADSILGASALGDIGIFFSDQDINNKGLDSKKIIEFCLNKIESIGMEIYNIDSTIICEQPKINPFRDNILKSLSQILGIPESKIGLKATTAEKLGIIGKNKAISVQSLVNLKDK